MDSVARVGSLVVAGLLLCWSLVLPQRALALGAVNASGVQSVPFWWAKGYPGTSAHNGSSTEAAQEIKRAMETDLNTRSGCPGSASVSPTFQGRTDYGDGYIVDSYSFHRTWKAGGNCVCDLGYRTSDGGMVAPGTSCQPYKCDQIVLKDSTSGPYTKRPALGGDAFYCDTTQTQYQPNPTFGCAIGSSPYNASQGPDGKWWVTSVNAFIGKPCDVGSSNDPAKPYDPGASAPSTAASAVATGASGPPSATSCAPGTAPGTVNGTPVCAPASQTVGVTNKTIEQGSGVGSGGVGSGSSSQQTSCFEQSCITQTTTYDSSGTAVSVVSSTGTKQGYCKAQPLDPQCSGAGGGSGGEGFSQFGGSCSAGFTCEGDAVSCAMAKEQHERDCQVFDSTTPYTDAVVAMQAQRGASQAGAGSSTVTLGGTGPGGLDQTDLIGAGCPVDQVVAGVTLPFSKLCTPATWLGRLLVGITALACAGIIFSTKGS